eukprot:gnl/TRDRNA2_/TRDRNA2_177687_c0_seq10.p1 gnl/TRDRNA2_/TRDRNA2_177687_c0~~gnl/TRDRNA2_/TRDRNA2_177687_c0_seq10.p1  ORF type:complete len:171 (-),score=47.96 gnl/TRDRNA2_/TRDRNA2_177687_c0_seq10:260-772(-)
MSLTLAETMLAKEDSHTGRGSGKLLVCMASLLGFALGFASLQYSRSESQPVDLWTTATARAPAFNAQPRMALRGMYAPQAAMNPSRSFAPLIVRGDTEDKIQKMIAEQLSVDEGKITPASSFVDLGADSLDTVELLMALEEEFGVEIPEEEAQKLTTVQAVIDYAKAQGK